MTSRDGPGPVGFIQPTTADGLGTLTITSDQLRRVLDPNIPPSYDQAVSGNDKAIKLEEGTSQAQSAVAMETVVSSDNPPAYTPFSQSTNESSTSSAPLPTYDSDVRISDDCDPLLT